MVRDALIAKKGRYGWRWCVVPVDLLDAFRAHGWITVLSSDEMHDIWTAAIEDVRKSDEQPWTPINRMRFFQRPGA
jgi:hypothetical protein